MPDAPTVVWTGQIQGWQGLSTLVGAASELRTRVPDARIVIVGDGRLRPRLEDEVREAGLEETVAFTGRIPYERVGDHLGAADVCVATFPGDRGLKGTISSLKIMNYLACGRPVVTSDMDEMGAVIAEAGAGAVVPADDPRELAAALARILSETQDVRAGRGDAARRLAESRTWRHKADRVRALLEDVLA